MTDRLGEAVANGRIDADQAAEIETRMVEQISERINTVHEGRPQGPHDGANRGPFRQEMIQSLTDLGLDADALRAGRQEGKTLAEVAAEAGVSEDSLVDALVQGAQERLSQAQQSGRMSDERMAEMTDGLEERITQMISRQPGEGHSDRSAEGRPGGFGGQSGMGQGQGGSGLMG